VKMNYPVAADYARAATKPHRGLAVLGLFVVLLSTTARSSEAQRTPAGSGSDSRGSRQSATTRSSRVVLLEFSSSYHENPFGLQRHWTTDPGADMRGSRLAGYASHWDVIGSAGLTVSQRWRRADRSRFGVDAGVTYDRYLMNSQHSRAAVSVALQHRTSGRASTSLQLELVPRTLDGNRPSADGSAFDAAFYSGLKSTVEHRRYLSARWSVRGRGEYAVRRFDSDFAYRDRQLIGAESRLVYQLGERTDLAAVAGIGRVSPLGAADSQLSRRYDYADIGAVVTVSQERWRFRARAGHRDKTFGTYLRGSGSEVDRRDAERRVDATVTRQASERTSVWLQSGYRTRVSDRSVDDVGTAGPTSSGTFVRLGTEITLNR
jgi:hypothetical protein